ncbi:hypothetical protein M0812_11787 [Anaeramoeba flamelloides]|uniref:Uncharacterized protein n=1 Tax=Anaeramoeba flamelloides TaxID=1746091 RepID=A0AAV8A138_9EUKA|nr:hypothetical protein M0812_11787 [Anaeramoeba flamelloides]
MLKLMNNKRYRQQSSRSNKHSNVVIHGCLTQKDPQTGKYKLCVLLENKDHGCKRFGVPITTFLSLSKYVFLQFFVAISIWYVCSMDLLEIMIKWNTRQVTFANL